LRAQIEDVGLRFAVVESIPVHEDIKLGRPGRDRLIDNYCASIASMGELGIPVLCYNFMPVFDWTRTDLAMRLPDGSTALAYDDRALAAIDLPAMVRRLGGRIHFAHCRNVRITGDRQFHETAHPSPCGSVDLFQVLCALRDVGFAGPMRPDHGRMIWGETGRPGYGLYDRAL